MYRYVEAGKFVLNKPIVRTRYKRKVLKQGFKYSKCDSNERDGKIQKGRIF